MTGQNIAYVAAAILAYLWDWLSSPKLWAGAAIPALFLLFLLTRRYPLHSVKINLPFHLGSMTYNTTPADRILAWKLYVQLTTRKAALLFDEDHDLVADIYDSLFTLFSITRELLLELPPEQFQNPSGLSSLMLRVENDGVRPHLTRWQADFRRWWERAIVLDENIGKSPQEIQRLYPQYSQLVDDLKRTNTELSKFADELLAIARRTGRKPSRPKVAPLPPTS